MDEILRFGPWTFVVAGVVLVALETMAPGAFMLWLGLAALATGLVLFVAPLGWELALVLFAVLAGISVLIGRRVAGTGPRRSHTSLNERGRSLVGRVFVLDQPISERRGRVRVDDTVWRVEGPDVPAGTQVRVVGVDGTLLKVERAG